MKRWAPKNKLGRKIARLLLLAHRAKVIELGAWTVVQVEGWQWVAVLGIGSRLKLGTLWREHGRKVIDHVQSASDVELAPEQREQLEEPLVEASC